MCLQIAQTPTESFYRINPSKITEIVEEAKKDLPTPEEIQQALAQLMNFVPDTIRVKKFIQEYLEKQYNATWKWFYEKGEG